LEDIAKLDEFKQNLSAHKCITDRLIGSHGFITIDLGLDSIVVAFPKIFHNHSGSSAVPFDFDLVAVW
jgi:hypothetical protein